MIRCYVGLGGNIGDSELFFIKALAMLKETQEISELHCSRLYYTSPVDCYSEQTFLNCVVTFLCTLSAPSLFYLLEEIEHTLGKRPKAKNAPRLIDIDLLFYGSHLYYDKIMIIPHPRWHTRLFVVQPLAELTTTLELTTDAEALPTIINIQKTLFFLQSQNKEEVYPL